MIQGIGVGGEWGGSVLLAMEWSRTHGQRGLVASWPQFGVPCGLFLANLSILAFSTISGDQFAIWGWRIPFAISIILVGIGLWIRLGILETPVFQQLLNTNRIERAPIVEVIKRHPREIILSALLRMSEQAPFYIFTAFVFAYAVATLHMSRDFVLTAVLVASVVSFVTIPLSGHISDRIGRRKMYLVGAAATGIFGFVYFGMIDTAIPWVVFLAIVLFAHSARYPVRTAGSADCRGLYATVALQRLLARLSAGLDHCRRPSAADRDGFVRNLSVGLCRRHLHRRLCGGQPDIGGADARLHGQRHLDGIRRGAWAGTGGMTALIHGLA